MVKTTIIELTDSDIQIYTDTLEKFILYNVAGKPISERFFVTIRENADELSSLLPQTLELDGKVLEHARATVLESLSYMKPLSLELAESLKENYTLISRFMGISQEEQEQNLEVALSNTEENNKVKPSLTMLLNGWTSRDFKQQIKNWRHEVKNTKPVDYDMIDNSLMETLGEGLKDSLCNANETELGDSYGKLLDKVMADSVTRLGVIRSERRRIYNTCKKQRK